MAKIYALDWGRERWGLASGDSEFKISLPQNTLIGKNKFESLLQTLKSENCSWLIIGYPYNMDGSRGKNCEIIDKIKLEMEKNHIKVDLWDERLSSFEAEINLRDQGFKGAHVKELLDSQSAYQILKDFFISLSP